ncbi:hypothetical protein GCM10010294_08760 [Streptomyces griseoloalbus]|nr:hypothetical protein GCM10010294_08760 [Streptomyces griseoloalbus]
MSWPIRRRAFIYPARGYGKARPLGDGLLRLFDRVCVGGQRQGAGRSTSSASASRWAPAVP